MTKLEIIYNAVCDITGLEIDKNTRKTEYIRARQIFCKLAKTFTMSPLTEIGKEIGKDHASIIHALKHFEMDIEKVEKYNSLYQEAFSYVRLRIPTENTAAQKTIAKDMLIHHVINQSKAIQELKLRLMQKPKGVKVVIPDTKHPIINQIKELDDEQLKTFAERAEIMLKSIKSMRTYDNTPRSSFNPKKESLKVAV